MNPQDEPIQDIYRQRAELSLKIRKLGDQATPEQHEQLQAYNKLLDEYEWENGGRETVEHVRKLYGIDETSLDL